MNVKEQNRMSTPHWYAVIDNAIANAHNQDRPFDTEATDEAGDWVDCACGRQDARIPRAFDGRPEDDKLERLGEQFPEYLEDANTIWADWKFGDDSDEYPLSEILDAIQEAEDCLNEIQVRSVELLNELGYPTKLVDYHDFVTFYDTQNGDEDPDYPD